MNQCDSTVLCGIPAMATGVNQDLLPKTDSIEELAKFWDTHSLADYEHEMEEAVEVSSDLPRSAIKTIRALAKSKGIAERELLREWLLQKMKSL